MWLKSSQICFSLSRTSGFGSSPAKYVFPYPGRPGLPHHLLHAAPSFGPMAPPHALTVREGHPATRILLRAAPAPAAASGLEAASRSVGYR